jgi:hypothetical protein
MVCSATGTVPKTWPAAENFSVFRLLWRHHHRTIASATDNSRDRIYSNARSVRKVRCDGSLFSRRAPQRLLLSSLFLENTPVEKQPRKTFLQPGEPFHAAPLVPRQRLVLASGPVLELAVNVSR